MLTRFIAWLFSFTASYQEKEEEIASFNIEMDELRSINTSLFEKNLNLEFDCNEAKRQVPGWPVFIEHMRLLKQLPISVDYGHRGGYAEAQQHCEKKHSLLEMMLRVESGNDSFIDDWYHTGNRTWQHRHESYYISKEESWWKWRVLSPIKKKLIATGTSTYAYQAMLDIRDWEQTPVDEDRQG